MGVYRNFGVSLPHSSGAQRAMGYGVGSLAEAQEKLVGGELLDAVAYAFTASNTYIPSSVFVMRVNDGSQSSVTLKRGANDLMKVKSWDWGVHTNQVKMMIADGTIANSKKITVAYKDKVTTQDNIINAVMSCNYYGDGQNPTVSVGVSNISFAAESIPEEGEQSEPIDLLTINFSDFDTIDSLVAYINDSDCWQANVIGNNRDVKSVKLDTLTNAAIGENGLTLYANFDAFINALVGMPYIGEYELLSESTRNVPDNTDSYVYFTGGTVGAYTVAQWNQALSVLALKDIQIIATPSTEVSIHALISSHCTEMSNVMNRKERTCILGGPVGMTDDAALEEALGLNNKLVSFVCDNAYKINTNTGNKDTLSGAMLGVMLAAMESSMSPNTPLTFKQLNVLGFTKTRTITNMKDLIVGGIMVCNANPEDLKDFICIRAMTTFQGDDLIYNERSMVREDLFMNRDLRQQFKPAIGTAGTVDNSLVSPNSAVKTLKDTAKQWALNGYIIPTDSNENVWDIKVRVDGDKRYITYSRYLTAPVNFVFITAVNHIYTSTQEL
jgi:hypothetical protein